MVERGMCSQWLGAQSRTGPPVSWAVGENCPPQTSSSSVLNSQVSERSRLRPGGPTGDVAQRRPPGEHSLPSQIQKGEPRVWMPGLNMGPFLQSIQTLTKAMVHCQYHPWGVTRVGCYLGGGCLSLYPKNIVWGERGKKPSTRPAQGNARGGYAILRTPVCRWPNLCCDIVQL